MAKKEPIMVRAAKCKRLIDQGKSLRAACKEADIDDKGFKRCLAKLELGKDSLTKQEIEMLNDTKESLEKVIPAPKPTPVRSHVKIKEILIRLPIDDYNYLVAEKERTGITPSTNAARIVREWIRERTTFKLNPNSLKYR